MTCNCTYIETAALAILAIYAVMRVIIWFFVVAYVRTKGFREKWK
jgi:hypothetical protein